jgi:hypothetical protein
MRIGPGDRVLRRKARVLLQLIGHAVRGATKR